LKNDPLETTNLVLENYCDVNFRIYDLPTIKSILNETSWLNYCNETTLDYYDNNDYINDSNNSTDNNNADDDYDEERDTRHLYKNATFITSAVQDCVRSHHENAAYKIRVMMAKLSVFVKYGNVPYTNYISEANKILKSTSTSTSTSTSSTSIYSNVNVNVNELGGGGSGTGVEKETGKEGGKEGGKGTERGSETERENGSEVGAGKGTVIVTCNTPIASDLKSLRFLYSEGKKNYHSILPYFVFFFVL
jgi:hypothetical protein